MNTINFHRETLISMFDATVDNYVSLVSDTVPMIILSHKTSGATLNLTDLSEYKFDAKTRVKKTELLQKLKALDTKTVTISFDNKKVFVDNYDLQTTHGALLPNSVDDTKEFYVNSSDLIANDFNVFKKVITGNKHSAQVLRNIFVKDGWMYATDRYSIVRVKTYLPDMLLPLLPKTWYTLVDGFYMDERADKMVGVGQNASIVVNTGGQYPQIQNFFDADVDLSIPIDAKTIKNEYTLHNKMINLSQDDETRYFGEATVPTLLDFIKNFKPSHCGLQGKQLHIKTHDAEFICMSVFKR